MMDDIKVVVSIDKVEDLFRNHRKCRQFAVCTTTILELQHSIENYLAEQLMLGHSISVADAFENAVDNLFDLEEEWC